MVKQVSQEHWYSKKVTLNQRQETVEVCLTVMRKRDNYDTDWLDCLQVGLKIPNSQQKELSAEEFVDRWELLRDIWLQLAEGL